MRVNSRVFPSDLTLPSFVLQSLLIDGYISQTFQSRAAEQYFLSLLKTTSIPSYLTSSYTGREGYFFFIYSAPPHIPTPLPDPPSRWLLDRGIVDGGTVVPQTMWPQTVIARRRNVDRAELQMPIFFENKDGGLGLSLGASVNGQRHVLRDAHDPAPLGQKTTLHIRILVSVHPSQLGCGSLAEFDISGLVIKILSDRSQLVTRRASAIPSPWLGSSDRSGGL